MNYYNENEPGAAEWLRELIRRGLIADGVVDHRSVVDVSPGDLRDFLQCHFFAGIGGWSYALRLAGWPDDRPVWTGSCPCQPFSQAGKGKGTSDARHLWPEFCRLISQRNPPVIFGEQVASKAGRLWLTGVRADLEEVGYAVGAADLCAASLSAPHIRQRLFWVADSKNSDGRSRERREEAGTWQDGERGQRLGEHSTTDGVDHDERNRRTTVGSDHRENDRKQSSAVGAWSNFDLLPCRDGKARRVESGTFPLAHGIPGRVGLLRGYGNAIVPQVAAEFIRAYEETLI